MKIHAEFEVRAVCEENTPVRYTAILKCEPKAYVPEFLMMVENAVKRSKEKYLRVNNLLEIEE